ncbi:MAG: alpha-hydroxy-acid oxidizing protein [Cyanobacteria bacterium SZAS TMP-1]|nr:alpha-hydroxy-acid oxidizing protein [Cyanobacteria bacterium SZAS TMP-1]
MAYDYYAGGCNDEQSVKRNRCIFNEILIRPRMLRDVSRRDLSVELLGQKISMPVIIAPTAFQKLAHEKGELETALAARQADTIMTVSTLATTAMEEVAAVAPHHLWFQLYIYKNREITKDLVARAAAAGYKALVVTVDSPILGRRERDIRNAFHLPQHLSAANLVGQGLGEIGRADNHSGLAAHIAALYDHSLTWDMLDWIVSISKLPVLVKGILRGDDALLALEHGARGIIVSNHGGRQIDTAVSPIEVLPEIVKAVGSRSEILVDGGIRRGTDIFKALALGARAVLIGRPVLWALATGGGEGVARCLEMLRQELDLTMALSGCATTADITPDMVKIPQHMAPL